MQTLTNVKIIYEQFSKFVYEADSAIYGPVIIKKDKSVQQLKSEYEMLSKMKNRYVCKVISFDENKGELVEERILPGTVLREEKSLEKRLEVFKSIFCEIHREETYGKTYLDWLSNIVKYCETNPAGASWLDRAKMAYAYCKELFEKYGERVLLHGDLHHDNILQREDGSYAMIDPKGIIGPRILDLPRFILNEIDTAYEGSAAEHIENVIKRISEKLDYPEEDVAKAFVMEAIMANVWFIEDGMEINPKQMEVAKYIWKKL